MQTTSFAIYNYACRPNVSGTRNSAVKAREQFSYAQGKQKILRIRSRTNAAQTPAPLKVYLYYTNGSQPTLWDRSKYLCISKRCRAYPIEKNRAAERKIYYTNGSQPTLWDRSKYLCISNRRRAYPIQTPRAAERKT